MHTIINFDDPQFPFARLRASVPARTRSGIRKYRVSRAKTLTALDSAQLLSDLRFPPGHQLEALIGDRKGQHSIRINDQYRVCFTWKDGHAYDVEITKHYR